MSKGPAGVPRAWHTTALLTLFAVLGVARQAAAERLFVEGGNDQFGVSIADTGFTPTDELAGYFTAWTRLEHPISDLLGKVGFLCDFDPVDRDDRDGAAGTFTHAAIRSYSSATDYPLGSNRNFIQAPAPGFECRPTSDWTLPTVEQELIGGVPVGVRATWSIVNGVDDLSVEVLLRAHGMDAMDAAVQLSVRVVNHSDQPATIGVRQSLQLVRSGTRGSGRSIRYLGFRSLVGPTEPLDQHEREWEAPSSRAWEGWAVSESPYTNPGSDVYAVAGALSGPESLEPAPTPPDLMQFAQMNTFGVPRSPGLADSCFEWELPDPPRIIVNPAALALTWGHDEAHAIHLDPGGEVTLTQYLMAFITYPLEVETFGPWEQECAGETAVVAIGAEALPLYDTEAEIFHEWSSTDPRVSFEDPSAPETTAHVEGTGTFPVHHRTWVGPWEAHADDQIVIVDSEPPHFEALQVSPSSLWPPNHRLEDITVEWTVSDNCDANPTVRLVSVTSNEPERHLPGRGAGNTERDILGADFGEPDQQLQLRAERSGGGSGRIYTLTYEAEDASGNLTYESIQVRVAHDRGRRR